MTAVGIVLDPLVIHSFHTGVLASRQGTNLLIQTASAVTAGHHTCCVPHTFVGTTQGVANSIRAAVAVAVTPVVEPLEVTVEAEREECRVCIRCAEGITVVEHVCHVIQTQVTAVVIDSHSHLTGRADSYACRVIALGTVDNVVPQLVAVSVHGNHECIACCGCNGLTLDGGGAGD